MRREIRKKKVILHYFIVFAVYLFAMIPTEAKSEKQEGYIFESKKVTECFIMNGRV
jgi:hypothetical protein